MEAVDDEELKSQVQTGAAQTRRRATCSERPSDRTREFRVSPETRSHTDSLESPQLALDEGDGIAACGAGK